jgi:hypothetical protein
MKCKTHNRCAVLLLFSVSVALMTACGGGEKKQPAQPAANESKPIAYGGGSGLGGDTIPVTMADNMITLYKGALPRLLSGAYRGDSTMMPLSETFDRSVIDALLAQEGVAGVRIYLCMGEGERGKIKVLLVGTDKGGNDILQAGDSGRGVPRMVVEEGNRNP